MIGRLIIIITGYVLVDEADRTAWGAAHRDLVTRARAFDAPGENALVRPADVTVTKAHVLVIDVGDRPVKRLPNPFRRKTPC